MEIVLFLRHESLISPKIWDWILGFPQCSIREVDERLFGFWKADAGYGKAAGAWRHVSQLIGCLLYLEEALRLVLSTTYTLVPGTVAQNSDPKSYSKFLSLKK